MKKTISFILLSCAFVVLTFMTVRNCYAQPNPNLLKQKADSALVFCKKKGFDTHFCILIDMKIHSGLNRFFVWNFQKNEITYAGLCCHGSGGGSSESKPMFSNREGSYCTSLGKYKVSICSYSKWGIHIHYKLHGLESSNNNAFKRTVVMHSHDPVPSVEIHPFHLPMGFSLGCPVISNDLMRKVDTLLKNTKKPVLLWIYN